MRACVRALTSMHCVCACRLEYVTTGILLRQLTSPTALDGVSHIIIVRLITVTLHLSISVLLDVALSFSYSYHITLCSLYFILLIVSCVLLRLF